jgi:hypothetical protein
MPALFQLAKTGWVQGQQEEPDSENSKSARRQGVRARANPGRWNEENIVYLSGHMDMKCSLLMLKEREEKSIAVAYSRGRDKTIAADLNRA